MSVSVATPSDRAARDCEEKFFLAGDGTRLFYRYWPPANAATARHSGIVLLHRGHEHSGRLAHVVDELELDDFAMFAWDARGHGLSANGQTGSINLATFVEDLQAFVRHLSLEYGLATQDIAVVAQSVGSVLAAVWVHDYAPGIRCMVLASPAFKVKLYVPFARPTLAIMDKWFDDMHVNSYVKAGALTHDTDRIASFKADPLIQRPISVRVLLGLYSTAERVIKDAAAIRTPTLLLISGSDYVVHHKPQHDFFNRLGSSVKEKCVFDGFYHDTLGEKNRHLPIAKAREFILRMFEETPRPDSLTGADKRGFTKDEFNVLSRPLPTFSLKAAMFGVTRVAMSTGGRLSEGIRLGFRTGFDSGSTLDYVYRNHPSGITPVGRLIDWFYLNSIGWRGIRVRKQHLERLLIRAMDLLISESRHVRIIDIAAGHGRYVLEAVGNSAVTPDSVLLRDYSEENVQKGTALILKKGMEHFARFEKGDAFDRASLSAIQPQATLAVVSGLYELFSDNSQVKQSVAGIADAVERDGYLVYTGQPWHPQLEMIARVLPSHRDHKPWVMRRRTQAELDELVEAAGFSKLDQLTDEWGIFTVSLARRR